MVLPILCLLVILLFSWALWIGVRRIQKGGCPFHRNRPDVSARIIKSDVAPPDPVGNLESLDADNPANRTLLENLQGNILSGHGRDYAAHIFIRIVPGQAAAARQWLADFARKEIVSAYRQFHSAQAFKKTLIGGDVFAHLSLSSSGYEAIGISKDRQPKGLNPHHRSSGHAEVFQSGMKSRQPFLLDPQVNQWESAYQETIDAVIILAADDQTQLTARETAVSQSLSGIATVVAVEHGMALHKRLTPGDPSTDVTVEHFGYVDGRSQPLFLKNQMEGERAQGGTDVWNPLAPLSLVLTADTLAGAPSSFGSFLVFRKLEQNVRGFHQSVEDLGKALNVPAKLAGAMAVGRFKDGTPVVTAGADGQRPVTNNFDYSGDAAGLKCPFQSHIRKTNPRHEAVGNEPGLDATVEDERGHRIVRRGIPYGGPLNTSSNADELPQGGVGLLFFCFQSDIVEQYEFIQRRWCNNPFFLQPEKSKPANYDKTGLDPLIGQAHPTAPGKAQPPANWPAGWNQPTVKPGVDIAGFVTLKGGEYFFSPSLSFLTDLAAASA